MYEWMYVCMLSMSESTSVRMYVVQKNNMMYLCMYVCMYVCMYAVEWDGSGGRDKEAVGRSEEETWWNNRATSEPVIEPGILMCMYVCM